MARRYFLAIGAIVLVLPSAARAVVDVNCGAQAISAVSGTVKNSLGAALSGITIELRQSGNKTGPGFPAASTTTDASGAYVLCVNPDTYDVRASDSAGLYATAAQQITTYTAPESSVDFSLQYMLNQTVTPQAISVPLGTSTKAVSWTIRSKAPSSILVRLKLDHLGPSTVDVPYTGTEFGGPSSGGWNVWTYSSTITHALSEGLYWATATGLDPSGRTQITELGRDPYLVDNQTPRFGPQNGPGVTACDGNPGATAFSPTQTTNPRAVISLGVCDPASNGGSSSLDPYSLSVQVWDPTNTPITSGTVILNQLTIQYLPGINYKLGTYTFRFTIADNAGNTSTSGLYSLNVVNVGGSKPVIDGPEPGNFGQAANPVVIGSQYTTPLSVQVVAFHASDPDGQGDLSLGSVHLRIYGPDGATMVYDYDPRLPCNPNSMPRISCVPNSGFFNPGTGRFQAYGFSLQGKPPGLYVATASIEDHGGNSASLTWRWILGAVL